MAASRPRLLTAILAVAAAAFALPPAAPAKAPATALSAARAEVQAGRLDRDTYRSWRMVVKRVRASAGRMTGARRGELLAVLRNVDRLAAEGRLHRDRMPIAFLTLRRNLETWTTGPLPTPGERRTFGRDPAVFQYYSGKGLQHHPLATAGMANALATPCLTESRARARARVERAALRGHAHRLGAPAPRPGAVAVERPRGPRCRPARLGRALDALTTAASQRSGFTAWEYQFDYGGGKGPWISAMTQATAAQALARGGTALQRPETLQLATQALGAFEQRPPAGVAPGDGHYLMYSFNPGLRILNGFLQSVIGLHDVAELTGSRRARRLYESGERSAFAVVRSYDTGAWSLYAKDGHESNLNYHRLVRGFLGGLCDRTDRRTYCSAERRFALYEREPPRVQLAAPARVRAGHATQIAFSLSKLARVTVRMRGRKGRLMRRTLSLSRGSHTLPWRPTGRGKVRVRIDAVGPSGPRAVVRETVRVIPRPSSRRRAPGGSDRHAPARDTASVRGTQESCLSLSGRRCARSPRK